MNDALNKRIAKLEHKTGSNIKWDVTILFKDGHSEIMELSEAERFVWSHCTEDLGIVSIKGDYQIEPIITFLNVLATDTPADELTIWDEE